MYSVLIVLAIIVSILLVFIVLIQNSKGGGLAANFASGNQIFGVRQTADTLEKATWYLSITLGLLCVIATLRPPSGKGSDVTTTNESVIQRNSNLMQNPAAQPGFGIEQTQANEEQDAQQTQQQEQTQQPQETVPE
ncbi:MAG: preprotein translocase subunit SecG [Prevotellaceae bacterium]|jgi:preprotein translocase subunit SecG|nr:preprotein translocase subunit SecG [Prevotellaceae bacterium]